MCILVSPVELRIAARGLDLVAALREEARTTGGFGAAEGSIPLCSNAGCLVLVRLRRSRLVRGVRVRMALMWVGVQTMSVGGCHTVDHVRGRSWPLPDQSRRQHLAAVASSLDVRSVLELPELPGCMPWVRMCLRLQLEGSI